MQYLVAVTAEERLPIYFGPKDDPDHATVYVRRAPSWKHQELVSKYTNNLSGVIDWNAVRCDLCDYCVEGWDNYQDSSGKPVQFHKDLIKWIPIDARMEIAARLTESSITSFL